MRFTATQKWPIRSVFHPSNLTKCLGLFSTVSVPASYSCTRNNRASELNSESGSLASFNYPLSYDDFGACDWKIRVSVFKRIELSFDFFNLSDPSPKCLDYVQIGNDKLDNERNIPLYCGSEKPAPFTSKGRVMWVWFYSSGRTKYPGFKASYKAKCEYCSYVGESFLALNGYILPY